MRNIYVLPTNKPSWLYKEDNVYKLDNLVYGTGNQNIYITNSEEIKEGDWCIITDIESVLYGRFEKHRGTYQRNDQFKKIILTTDADLIKDGVQEIDGEFLEWFVKNPSCEKVEVTYGVLKPFQSREKGHLIHYPDNEVLEEPCDNCNNDICCCIIREEAKRVYSEEDLKEAFIEGYKQRAIGSDLIFDEASIMYAIHLFNQFKKK